MGMSGILARGTASVSRVVAGAREFVAVLGGKYDKEIRMLEAADLLYAAYEEAYWPEIYAEALGEPEWEVFI